MAFEKRENLLWVSVLFIALLGYNFEISYYSLLLLWVVSIICVGNAKRIHVPRFAKSTALVRRSLYILPYLLPVIIVGFNNSNFQLSIFWLLISVVVGVLFVGTSYSSWKWALNSDFIEFELQVNKRKTSGFYTIVNVFNLVLGAISEEVFFRLFILTISSFWSVNLLLSMFLFTIAHYGTKWGDKFDKKDIIIQVSFAFVSSILFLLSKSIVPSIIAHLIYNTPHLIRIIKIYYISKKG